MPALVLGGGNALGAYHGGVVSAMEAAGVEPDWLAGSSIGAVMAALVAGNPPGRRTAAVREFWRRGASLDGPASWVPEAWRRAFHLTAALQARTMGRPALYHLRVSQLLGLEDNPGVYDLAPMRRTLEELVDFGLPNSGPIRVSVMTVDLESGLETPFDTVRERLDVNHFIASTALIPDFSVIEIGRRAYADGGLAANLPVDPVLREPPAEPLACFTADPFPRAAPRPRRPTPAPPHARAAPRPRRPTPAPPGRCSRAAVRPAVRLPARADAARGAAGLESARWCGAGRGVSHDLHLAARRDRDEGLRLLAIQPGPLAAGGAGTCGTPSGCGGMPRPRGAP